MPDARLEKYHGIQVVRDDLYPGGTKARIFEYLYSKTDEVVYACAAFSRSQVSLGLVAQALGKKATVFVPARKNGTIESTHARTLGVVVHEIRPGYLSVVTSRAKKYADQTGAYLAPLGFDTQDIRAALAQSISVSVKGFPEPEEVWCSAGSGMLTRTLQMVWPVAEHHAVQVGKDCDVGRAIKYIFHMPLEKSYLGVTDFPSDRHYDAKAWSICRTDHSKGCSVLFWNVLG